MSTTSNVPKYAPAQFETSSAQPSIVSVQPSLSPQEVERISKAFIRLILAKEKTEPERQ